MARPDSSALASCDGRSQRLYRRRREKLRDAGVRVEICTGQRLAKLVRTAEKAKLPVMAVVGREEAENNTLAVRTFKDGDVGTLSVDEVLSRVTTANATKGQSF